MFETVDELYTTLRAITEYNQSNNTIPNSKEDFFRLKMDSDKVRRSTNQILKLKNELFHEIFKDDLSTQRFRGLNYSFPDHIVMVGCGGIGSWFLPKLIKLLNDAKLKFLLPDFKSLTIIDADKVSDSNLRRQNFSSRDVGKNKAEVLYKRYCLDLNEDIDFSFIDKYLLSESSIKLKEKDIQDNFVSIEDLSTFIYQKRKSGSASKVLFINLIDNNESRKDIHAYLNSQLISNRYKIYDCIDVANGTYNGQLNLTLGNLMSRNPVNYYDIEASSASLNYWEQLPENMFLADNISLFDCSNRDVQSVEQLFDINNMGATILCSYLNSWIENKKIFQLQVEYTTGSNLSVKNKYNLWNFVYENKTRPKLNDLFSDSSESCSIFDLINKDMHSLFDSFGRIPEHKKDIVNKVIRSLFHFEYFHKTKYIQNPYADCFKFKHINPGFFKRFYCDNSLKDIDTEILSKWYQEELNSRITSDSLNKKIINDLLSP